MYLHTRGVRMPDLTSLAASLGALLKTAADVAVC